MYFHFVLQNTHAVKDFGFFKKKKMSDELPQPKKELFKCHKCRLSFNEKAKLANHINKFCKDSIFGDPNNLLKRLKLEMQDNSNTHLSFGEIKQYLKNNGGIKYDVRFT